MTSELLALTLSDSLRALWQRRGTLLLSVSLAAAGAFAAASVLPKTWESQVVLQVGQTAEKPLENGAAVARRINVGAIQCGTAPADLPATPMDAVTATVDPVAEFVELRLTATGRSPEEALARVSKAADCVRKRHRELYEVSAGRAAALRRTIEFQIASLKTTVSVLTRKLEQDSYSADAATDGFLLQVRLGEERSRQLELAQQLNALDAVHSSDTSTVVIGGNMAPPSYPVWPRRGLLTALAGAVALFVASAIVLFAAAVPVRSRQR